MMFEQTRAASQQRRRWLLALAIMAVLCATISMLAGSRLQAQPIAELAAHASLDTPSPTGAPSGQRAAHQPRPMDADELQALRANNRAHHAGTPSRRPSVPPAASASASGRISNLNPLPVVDADVSASDSDERLHRARCWNSALTPDQTVDSRGLVCAEPLASGCCAPAERLSQPQDECRTALHCTSEAECFTCCRAYEWCVANCIHELSAELGNTTYRPCRTACRTGSASLARSARDYQPRPYCYSADAMRGWLPPPPLAGDTESATRHLLAAYPAWTRATSLPLVEHLSRSPTPRPSSTTAPPRQPRPISV